MSEARYWPLNWVPDSFNSLPFQAINWKPNNRSEVIEECEVAEILATAAGCAILGCRF